MFRKPFVALLSAAGLTSIASAQSADDLPPIQFFQPPQSYFSAGLHYSGKFSAKFGNIGTIGTNKSVGDEISELNRTYNDGFVSKDTRTTDNGEDLPDDYRTNTWGYLYDSQVTSDQRGIAFHTYSTAASGSRVATDEGMSSGVDLEYARRLQSFGQRNWAMEPKISWGIMLGVTASGVNAKTSGEINANLITTTDTYSLNGAAVPPVGSQPSTSTETVTNPDGTTSTISVNTTTLLANRPDNRQVDIAENGAKVQGFWQIRGAYYTFRGGAWVRWQPTPRLAIRASLGPAVTWLGAHMRYDERLLTEGFLNTTDLIGESGRDDDRSFYIPGVFGSLDLEWWLTPRTALFFSGTFEEYFGDISLTTAGRTADIKFSGGIGVRTGVITRF
jgi:hypothetical protein